MKPEDIQHALSEIGDDLIQSAAKATATPKKSTRKVWKWIPAVAAILVCAILIGVFLQPKEDVLSIDMSINSAPNANQKRMLQILAKYPLAVSYPSHELYKQDENAFMQALSKWETYRNEQKKLFENANLELDSFFNATMQEMLTNSNGENKVYSPINVYLALSMLAEVTDGNSREQILDLLDVDDIEALRTQVSALWLSHYLEDGNSSLVLGNSIWLNENETYVEEAFQRLADDYFASSYEGNPRDEEYVQEFRDWINEQTHGLLKDGVDKLKFSPDMLMAIVSTIYFKAKWSMDFSQFEEDRFQTVNGDVEATFMKKTFDGPFYRGDIFSAVPYHFTQNTGCMWLILPNENTEIDTVLCSAEYQEFMKDPWSKWSIYEISLSLPKFDISCDSDLIPVLESLGITDVFLPGVADFSPSIITERDDYPPYVTKIQHNARVRIDEKGCEGAAYTVIEVDFGTSIEPPEYEKIVFELDRPFLFVVTSQHNVPLFSGVVNDPTAS